MAALGTASVAPPGREQPAKRGTGGDGGPVSLLWRFSDTGIERFGETVDDAVVQGPGFTELSGHALVEIDNVVYHAELVSDAEFDKWKDDKKAAEVDDRLLHCEYESVGVRELVEQLSNATRKWPSFSGPRACLEFLQSLASAQGSFVSYHAEWVRLSGVPQHSPAVYAHRHDLEVLRLALHTDGLSVSNLASMEQTVRHLLQLEKAVQRNASAPDYAGLGVITDGTVTAKGAAITSSFDSWIAEKQKERGKMLQNERLYREESKPSRSTGSAAERAERPAKTKKPKAKPAA